MSATRKTYRIVDQSHWCINTLRPRQDGRHFADDIFKCIFLNENVWIPIKISLKFVPKDPINNIPALDGAKPLSEPIMVSLPTHICVTRPQWVKPSLAKECCDKTIDIERTEASRQIGARPFPYILCAITHPLRPKQNDCHSDYVQMNVLLWKMFYFIQISLIFSIGLNDDNRALVLIIAWCRTGDNSLSEPMMA